MSIFGKVQCFFKEKFNSIKEFFTDNKKRTGFIAISSSVILLILISLVGFGLYVSDYYHTDWLAIYREDNHSELYSIEEGENGVVKFVPDEAKVGFIFYPGGKVEYSAYIPLMDALASRNVLCVLVEMPFNLAVLDVNAADGITEDFPEIEHWYIGGHSLGGSMAASYLDTHTDTIDGVVLLAAYSTADLTDSRVLSIYGSNDGVMNREKYESYKNNLPEGFTEKIIDGGNHAGFGMYGHQAGDGSLEISTSEQIKQTADIITAFVNNQGD